MHNILVGFIVAAVVLLTAQTSAARRLDTLIPGLYGGDGITLATDPTANHAAHFTVGSSASINRLNEQITSQIGIFPFSSSVSGFTFAFDPSLGTFLRTTESLGPLFAERAPTLGKGKLNLHFSYTFFTYDTFEGQSLSHFPVTARHEPDVIGFPDTREQFELDTVRIDLDIKLRVQIFAFAATYGITDRLDVGVFLPITSVDMDVKSHARVVVSPANTLFPNVHTFVGGPESPDDAAHGYAFGLGDVVLRAKYSLLKSDLIDVSGAFLTTLATGNHQDFLGSGATTLRPFLVLSRTLFDVLTPHLNIGYEFNLDRGHQSAVQYALGVDVGTPIWTVAAELLGSHEPAGDGIGDHIINGSLGVKWNPWKQLLVLANAQVPFNRNSGLRSDLILTFGAEYSF
jgi:outer membrane putative beta-barrel porin/alpha-amylase